MASDIAGLTLRAAQMGDAQALTDISNQPGVRRGTLRVPFESLELWQGRLAARETSGVRLIVAELDGEVVAYAGLHPQQMPRVSHAASIGISVADAHTGKGIGKALLAALIDLGENWLGLRRLELDVFVDNAAAIALYERFGFVREGVKQKAALSEGVFKDVVMMARLNF
jgi:putative acetyltransferase